MSVKNNYKKHLDLMVVMYYMISWYHNNNNNSNNNNNNDNNNNNNNKNHNNNDSNNNNKIIPKLVTVVGISTDVREMHPLNAYKPSLLMIISKIIIIFINL